MQYIKHYYVDDVGNNFHFMVETPTPQYKRHPWKEYPGLAVKVWLSDSDGIDAMLSQVPDETPVSTISNGSKNCVQELTEEQYNSVWTPYSEAETLYSEARQAQEDGDSDTAATKTSAADAKQAEALAAFRAL